MRKCTNVCINEVIINEDLSRLISRLIHLKGSSFFVFMLKYKPSSTDERTAMSSAHNRFEFFPLFTYAAFFFYYTNYCVYCFRLHYVICELNVVASTPVTFAPYSVVVISNAHPRCAIIHLPGHFRDA